MIAANTSPMKKNRTNYSISSAFTLTSLIALTMLNNQFAICQVGPGTGAGGATVTYQYPDKDEFNGAAKKVSELPGYGLFSKVFGDVSQECSADDTRLMRFYVNHIYANRLSWKVLFGASTIINWASVVLGTFGSMTIVKLVSFLLYIGTWASFLLQLYTDYVLLTFIGGFKTMPVDTLLNEYSEWKSEDPSEASTLMCFLGKKEGSPAVIAPVSPAA